MHAGARWKSRASAATGTTSPWTFSLTTAHAQAIGSPRAGTGMVGVMTRHTKSRLERGSGNLGRPARTSLLRTVEGTRELVGPLLTTFARVASTYDQNNASFRASRRVKTACNTLCTSGTAMSVLERWLSCNVCGCMWCKKSETAKPYSQPRYKTCPRVTRGRGAASAAPATVASRIQRIVR